MVAWSVTHSNAVDTPKPTPASPITGFHGAATITTVVRASAADEPTNCQRAEKGRRTTASAAYVAMPPPMIR